MNFYSCDSYCFAGNITISIPVSEEYITNETDYSGEIQNQTTTDLLSYCGYQSNFSTYPEKKKLWMNLHYDGRTFFTLHAVFSVLDTGFITSQQPKKINSMIIHSQFLSKNKRILHSFFLQVMKIYKIEIKDLPAINNQYAIYDGPGLLSTRLKPHVFTCSSFQCLIKVLIYMSTIIQNITYVSKLLSIQPLGKFYIGEEKNISSCACIRNPCIFSLEAPKGYQINATVTKLRYTGSGTNSVECKYGGIVTLEKISEKYEENPPICENTSISTGSNTNWYSQNSTLIVVIYWYEYYSIIHVNILLSQTICTLVKVDFLMTTIYCDIIVQSYDGGKSCNLYLRNISRFANMNFVSRYDGILFSFPKNSCSVIKVFQDCYSHGLLSITYLQIQETPFIVSFFDIKFHLNLMLDNDVSQSELAISMKGIFKTYSKKHEENCNERVYFSGTNFFKEYQFHISPDTTRRVLIGKMIDVCSTEETRYFWISTKIKTPVSSMMVEINIKFKPQTNSWADITVHKKKLHHISETQYLSESLQCSDMSKNLEQVGDSVTHVLLLSSHLAMCESESLVCHIEIDTKVNKYYYISVILENEIQFSKRRLQKFISLHEPAKFVTFMILDQCTGPCSTLRAVWLHDNYQKYAASKLKGELCNVLSFDLCLNFSLINVNYILLGRQIQFYEITMSILWHNPTKQQKDNIQGISWKQASKLCKSIGGYLPVFTTRDELDELLALIKLSQYMPPLMTIYIGLHVYNYFNMVGNLLCIQKQDFLGNSDH